ncbi:heme ABC transporter ATP-binding protein [Uliginosibacterium sp. H1]|uniref:heme ABC transporter ATP-binding protein n=1 Tax=Uliginosibacterium sp. H1 TaxID=3114757 RepID=UPI002E19D690|nr:heme ABC transporter ATP-binding protein [Uliginosibacterium sp. H1]
MLRAKDLHCARGNRVVLRGLTLDLPAGRVVGVLGANGAGKTSLLTTLAGELPTHAGEVALGDRPLTAWTMGGLARQRAVLPQSPSLSFDLSVGEVVAMGAYPFGELPAADRDALVTRALALADVAGLAARRYLTLSGGEQQRVHFARVAVQTLAARQPGEYRVLMLDEPTASLDPRHQILLLQGVRHLAREEGIAALLVLHDVNLAAQWCDEIVLLAGGQCLARGAPREVLTAATLMSTYGLPAFVMDHPAQPGTPLVLFAPAAG